MIMKDLIQESTKDVEITQSDRYRIQYFYEVMIKDVKITKQNLKSCVSHALGCDINKQAVIDFFVENFSHFKKEQLLKCKKINFDKKINENDFLLWERTKIYNTECFPFWEKEWDEKRKKMKLYINDIKFCDFVAFLGFYKIEENNCKPCFIRIQNNTVEEVNLNNIQNTLFKVFNDIKDEYLQKQVKTMRLDHLGAGIYDITLHFLKDTKDIAYIPFKNGVVKVTKTEKRLIAYKDLTSCIWKNQIINREIDLNKKNKDSEKTDWEDFMDKISFNNVHNFKWVLGYLMHNFRGPDYLIVLKPAIDSSYKDSKKIASGAGKSLLIKGLLKLVSGTVLNGKAMSGDLSNKPFAFQLVERFHKLVAIDDVPKLFNYELLSNYITGDFFIQKKFKRKIKIPYQSAPKVILTTSFNIPPKESSIDRRIKNLYITSFFSEELTVEDYYNKYFFDDWNSEDWNAFYIYMLNNIQYYLSENFETKKDNEKDLIRVKTSSSFCDFWYSKKFDFFNPYSMDDLVEAFADFKISINSSEKEEWINSKEIGKWSTAIATILNLKRSRNDGKHFFKKIVIKK